MIGRAFWLTELVIVKSQLPDYKFSDLSERDQETVIEVLRLFGDLRLFEQLPYEISGTEALRRLDN